MSLSAVTKTTFKNELKEFKNIKKKKKTMKKTMKKKIK